MKSFVLIILIFLTTCNWLNAQNMTPLDEFERIRGLREKSLRESQGSPLLPKDKENFKGLDYFKFDLNYRVKAKFVKTEDKKEFLMPTSTGGLQKYLKTGTLTFSLNGEDFSLGAFKLSSETEESQDIFIPYRDKTNGNETYSAGRYLYARKPKDNEEVVLDFNWSHNPSCAYNTAFVCTLPPKENSLPIKVKAGEKKYVSPNVEKTHLQD